MTFPFLQTSGDKTTPPAQVIEAFRPWWMLRNGHVQTLGGAYLFGRWPDREYLPPHTAQAGLVQLEDGDQLSYQDDCPVAWRTGDPVLLLLHGLAGSHDSPYMRRIARRAYQQNIRAIRLDWRGCGGGASLARYPYHSGRTEDLQTTVQELHRRFPNSPISCVGFSMGGNILLKYLGETGGNTNGGSGLVRAIAVCPPIDLAFTIESLKTGLAAWYNSYFARVCINNIRQRQLLRPDAIVPEGWFSRLPKNMREFDETFTAPICGFTSADSYYAKSSANQFLPTITTPTLIIGAQDDPVIPYQPFLDAKRSACTELIVTKHGGHMGFVHTAGTRWLDQFAIDWSLGIA